MARDSGAPALAVVTNRGRGDEEFLHVDGLDLLPRVVDQDRVELGALHQLVVLKLGAAAGRLVDLRGVDDGVRHLLLFGRVRGHGVMERRC